MNRGTLIAACLFALLVGSSQAATPIVYARDVVVDMEVLSDLALPVTLAAGRDGMTQIGPNGTSSASHLSASILERTFNTTVLMHPGEGVVFVRLVHIATAGSIVDCIVCKVALRGGASTPQILIVNGEVMRASGDWVRMDSTPQAEAQLWVHVGVLASGASSVTTTIEYGLDIRTAGSTLPVAQYRNLTASFTL